MGRPKSKPASAHVRPEGETREDPETEGGGQEGHGKAITKAEAIRRALAEGLTKHEDAAPFIKTNYGHDVSPGHFAASKSREKSPGEPAQEAPRRGRPPKKTEGVTVKVKRGRKPKAAAAPVATPNGEQDLIGSLELLKPLIAAHGADKVKRLVDLLG
jgi:hypothetical protein